MKLVYIYERLTLILLTLVQAESDPEPPTLPPPPNATTKRRRLLAAALAEVATYNDSLYNSMPPRRILLQKKPFKVAENDAQALEKAASKQLKATKHTSDQAKAASKKAATIRAQEIINQEVSSNASDDKPVAKKVKGNSTSTTTTTTTSVKVKQATKPTTKKRGGRKY